MTAIRRGAIAWLIAGCGAATPPPPIALADVAVPKLAHADFTVVPAELADPGVLDRIPHRARIHTIGQSWLRDDGPRAGRDRPMKANLVLPVIGETNEKLRIVIEDDKMRLALWLAKIDVWPVLAAASVLADADGKVRSDVGVFAARGAALHVESHRGSLRRVRVDDAAISLEGYVPASLVASVWLAGAGDPPPTLTTGRDAEWKPPREKPYTELAKGATVRAAPAPNAPAIAVVTEEGVGGRLVATRGGYAHVEIERRYARVVGFVVESELSRTQLLLGAIGGGRGHGFGMSHAEQIDVPAGTCLFDQLEGQVVGVMVENAHRLGSSRQDKPGWALIHGSTQWGRTQLYVKNLGPDPKQPKWEPCTQPAVRK